MSYLNTKRAARHPRKPCCSHSAGMEPCCSRASHPTFHHHTSPRHGLPVFRSQTNAHCAKSERVTLLLQLLLPPMLPAHHCFEHTRVMVCGCTYTLRRLDTATYTRLHCIAVASQCWNTPSPIHLPKTTSVGGELQNLQLTAPPSCHLSPARSNNIDQREGADGGLQLVLHLAPAPLVGGSGQCVETACEPHTQQHTRHDPEGQGMHIVASPHPLTIDCAAHLTPLADMWGRQYLQVLA